MEGKELNVEISSTTLGNTSQEGGKFGAVEGFVQAICSEDLYTKTIAERATEAQDITKEIFPNANFGISVLASVVNPEKMKGYISSIDYPYLVKLNTDFLKEKVKKGKEEGYTGLGLGIAVAQEYAYGLLQSHSDEEQIDSTLRVANVMEDMVKIRTCIETVSIEDEIRKIREINRILKDGGKSITWVIEPNKKIGDGTFTDFMNIYENIKNDPKNSNLKFGIDLDMGGLPKEEYGNVLNIMDSMHGDYFPIYLSLSGKDYTEGTVRTHLPLGDDVEFNRKLGEYLVFRGIRGQKIPGLIVETNPTGNVLRDYEKFLKGLKQGFN
ncbi:MAG TPA: hypothetical protein PLG10_02335 [Candidatus Dojkabacteria bacterium]|jgi:hypothetical protein|nr:hypothetical protein [Candidatus Dojkabacteria bacterium]